MSVVAVNNRIAVNKIQVERRDFFAENLHAAFETRAETIEVIHPVIIFQKSN